MSEKSPLLPASTAETPLTEALPSPEGSWDGPVNGTRVVFGPGTLERLGPLVRELGGRQVMLVTDSGLQRAGHAERALASLRNQGLEVAVFDEVEHNPTTRHVEAGVDLAHEADIDFLVALGGGSPMDCAKGINFLLTNGGEMEDYRGVNKAERPLLPSVAAPTTAGTGSEAQAFALIARESDRQKMACGDDKARFRAVILDPDLLTSLPARLTAVSGLDAIAHALESFVSKPADEAARVYAAAAWRWLDEALEQALSEPKDRSARARTLWGAHLAGAAIDRSMLGAAHACANPLTSRFGVEHGVAVALMLPHVIRFNGRAVEAAYKDLANRAGRPRGGGSAALAERVEALRAAGAMPATLTEAGVDRTAIPQLATEAAGQWTAGYNPVPVSADDLAGLYEAAC